MVVNFFFLKIGHSRPLFLYFRLFYKQLTVNKCSIKVADDWIRTRVLWYRKRPLCQLRHNHCHDKHVKGFFPEWWAFSTWCVNVSRGHASRSPNTNDRCTAIFLPFSGFENHYIHKWQTSFFLPTWIYQLPVVLTINQMYCIYRIFIFIYKDKKLEVNV